MITLAHRPAPRPSRATPHHLALLGGAGAMVLVGGSVATSATLIESPVLTGQAVRYAVASLLLVGLARCSGRSVLRPHGREWLWLLAVTVSGLVVFNLALVHGSRHAEPAVLGVAVACVPLALAAVGPLLEGAAPRSQVVVAAAVVTAGAGVVEGLGHADAIGLAWAGLVFVCEAGFTLCALPVLGRLGAYSVSVHTTWLAAVLFAILGVALEGPGATARLDRSDLLALAFLAVGVTALAFVLWYGCVHAVGSGRAGLLTGVAPVSAATTGVLLGGPVPGPAVWAGMLVVGVGLVIGLGAQEPR